MSLFPTSIFLYLDVPTTRSSCSSAPSALSYRIRVKLGIQNGHSDTELLSLLLSVFHIVHEVAIATCYSLSLHLFYKFG